MEDDGSTLKRGVAILAVLGVLVFCWMHHSSTTFAADGTDPDWDAAAQRSRDSGKPTVVLFTANWCPGCRWLHANVLSQSQVQDELERCYTFYTVDLTNPSPSVRAHAQKFGVSSIPLMIRYDANGKETDRTNNLGPDEMVKWLKAGE